MSEDALSFTHHFEPGSDPARPPLLLLHGTGGDENDLLPLAEQVAPGATLLAPRGKVVEGGMARFFRRVREGVFDQDDVRRRAGELAEFIQEARERYDLPAPIAVGFSNGANIAAALLWRHPETLSGAALLRAMVPLDEPPAVELTGKPVLILSGEEDRLIPAEHAGRLAAALTDAGAIVRHRTFAAGHGLIRDDVDALATWLDRQSGR